MSRPPWAAVVDRVAADGGGVRLELFLRAARSGHVKDDVPAARADVLALRQCGLAERPPAYRFVAVRGAEEVDRVRAGERRPECVGRFIGPVERVLVVLRDATRFAI